MTDCLGPLVPDRTERGRNAESHLIWQPRNRSTISFLHIWRKRSIPCNASELPGQRCIRKLVLRTICQTKTSGYRWGYVWLQSLMDVWYLRGDDLHQNMFRFLRFLRRTWARPAECRMKFIVTKRWKTCKDMRKLTVRCVKQSNIPVWMHNSAPPLRRAFWKQPLQIAISKMDSTIAGG
jgi:hypothetical protein